MILPAAVRAGAPALVLISISAGCKGDVGDARTAGEQGFDVSSAVTDAQPGNAPTGTQLYVVCSPCHGPQGQGTQLGPPLTGPQWIHIDGGRPEIERIIREGVAAPRDYPIPMPPMGGGDFDDAELDFLADYVHSLGPG